MERRTPWSWAILAALGVLLAGMGSGWAGGPVKVPATAGTPDFAGLKTVNVVGVADGRSLVVQGAGGQEIVSLLGVRAIIGEAGAGGAGAAAGEVGRSAADVLRDLTLDEPVYLVDHESGPRTDASGRRVCYVYRAPEGLLVNLELIRQGYAKADAEFAYQHLELFKQHESRAASAGRGLNSVKAGPEPVKPAPAATPVPGGATGTSKAQPVAATGSGVKVYITKSGTKYHSATCRFAKNGTAVTLEEAKAKGLTACSQCDAGK